MNSDSLAQLRPIFNELKPDKYLQEMLGESKPTRYRLFRQIKYDLFTNKITLTDNKTLRQNVNDFRKDERVFSLLPDHHFNNSALKCLLQQAALYYHNYDLPIDVQLDCNVHFVRQVAIGEQTATNAPEGRHQDGADFIVSAFVVNLSNVNGAISQVGTKDGFNYFQKQLLPGEGLLHDDQDYYHDISKVKPIDPKEEAIRDIIGFDFMFMKESKVV